ncbi:putative vacuolar endopolyphosphatase [Aspergillus nomiae NRRL 13137]|uniref:Endopolyphosphatase n=1 Tax=Aspergillus nomiae NRRL (strain ATCC 15546 / NRRL 13137 / CBS 260.88 / M93) TaxID=1509407 RepID=A0A0L1J4X3_ASPN3|nr:putative vacuolar endopolyphosphatase [Aspergillus nomiae NRRL 13137]KNG86794.1 putative vacuolar endopolyphosphatase [Aspergillus nomiae NRRL 13137]
MLPILLLPIISTLIGSASATPISEQQPLGDRLGHSDGDLYSIERRPGSSSGRGLTGRFLHITDLHPDSHYKAGRSVDEDDACHWGKGPAGYFGSEGSDCDSPLTLIDETFRWIEKNLKGHIDFVIWTGDSARHDNDERIPRTEEEVSALNEIVAGKFIETFKEGSSHFPSIPIVPTLGNNDFMPHNIFNDGPNRWTKRFVDVWAKFIPEHQRHTFVEGGWFTSEVIPNKLTVISLNTMYFFDSNSAVDGCNAKSQPGFEHMEWLRVQLQLLRSRDMKAILIGHVPPARSGSKRSWDETCWQKYTLWVHQYRDIIVGTAYGHMNIDHFMLQDSREVDILDASSKSSASSAVADDTSPLVSVQSRQSYLVDLRKDWSKMPSPPPGMSDLHELFEDGPTEHTENADLEALMSKKKRRKFLKKIGGPWAERYSVSLVSPSVVPNYFPSLRVVEYNISGLADATTWAEYLDLDTAVPSPSSEMVEDDAFIEKKKKGKKKKNQPHFKVPKPPSSSAPPGPAYSNQPFTWLGYTQYYANLTKINDHMTNSREVAGGSASPTDTESTEVPEASHGEDAFTYEVEYDTRDDRIYKMEDLTVRSFFELATRIAKESSKKNDFLADNTNVDGLPASKTGVVDDYDDDDFEQQKKKKQNKVWRTFLERAFVGFVDSDDLDDMSE